VLGDLFETWVGDDDDAPWLGPVLDAFAALARSVPVSMLHGNRDFLLGAGFAARSGARLVAEPCVVDLGGVRTVLVHGDAQCTDDARYQALRAQFRAPEWQRAFLAQPLTARRAFAEQARAASRQENADKDAYLMDVNPAAVAALLRASGATRLVHGHTHRPAQHALEVDGRRCERWVLGDWHGHGWVASAEGAVFRQEPLPY
jgi:UDP-2,3-diacylglucosamine hydrolase